MIYLLYQREQKLFEKYSFLGPSRGAAPYGALVKHRPAHTFAHPKHRWRHRVFSRGKTGWRSAEDSNPL